MRPKNVKLELVMKKCPKCESYTFVRHMIEGMCRVCRSKEPIKVEEKTNEINSGGCSNG